jgi:hypothetical protein
VLVEADQAESTIELLAPDDRLIARWDLDAGLPNGSAGATCTDLMPRPFEVKDGTALVLRITVVGQGFTGLATRRATRLATRLDRVILTTDPR